MAKLELDLKHNDVIVGSTSIDINSLPQFSLKFFSARPYKSPIVMREATMQPGNGLSYLGPEQPRDGFLTNNVYTIEVLALNVSVGTVIGLEAIAIADGLTVSKLQAHDGPVASIMDIVPINNGMVNVSGVAEFQVKFRKDMSIFNRYEVRNYLPIKFKIVSNRGDVVVQTPQAVVDGGDILPAGHKRAINPEVVNDRAIRVHPGQYGCWIDVFVGGAGAGAALSHGQDWYQNIPSKPGGHAAVFSTGPDATPELFHPNVNYWEYSGMLLALGEGGGASDLSNSFQGVGGIGAATYPANIINAYMTSLVNNPANRSYLKDVSLSVEVLGEGNGRGIGNLSTMNAYPYGGYPTPSPTLNNRNSGGESWLNGGPDGGGTGGWAHIRIHYRRRAAGLNIPIRPLHLAFNNEMITAELRDKIVYGAGGTPSWRPAKGPGGGIMAYMGEFGGGHASKLAGGKGGERPYAGWGSRFAWGGQSGFDGAILLNDFGHYTTYA